MSAVVIRCDGHHAIGLGHVSRCVALAEALRDNHRVDVTFAMRDRNSTGARFVEARRFSVDAIAADDAIDYGDELEHIVSNRRARALVVDVRDALSRASLQRLREGKTRIVALDTAAEWRLAADLAFYPPVPQVEALDWREFSGQRFTGWEYVLLRREFATSGFTSPELSDASPSIDLLVTMGGSDPGGMTEFTMRAIELLPMPLAVRLVIGPAFARAEPVIDAIARSKHSVTIARAPESLAPLMRSSRLAVCSFGVTAYELAACGVPAVHLCLTDDHARSSSAFDREGAAVTAGVFGAVTAEQLAQPIGRLMSRAGQRGQMARRAAELVDGRGAERAAAIIVGATGHS